MDTTPDNRNLLLTGWICLLLYWGTSTILPMIGSGCGLPLALAAFVLGVVAAARGSIVGGVLLLTVALAGGVISCGFGFLGIAGYGASVP